MKKPLLIFSVILWFSALSTYSQSSSRKGIGSSAQKNMAVGLKLGDPLGLTFKKYFGPKWGLEFIAGRTFYWGGGYGGYYDTKGKPVPSPDPNPKPGPAGDPYYDYGYYNPRGLALQMHLLYHKNISAVEGLQLYFGGGPQLRVLSYHYHYWYKVPGGWQYNDQAYHQVGIGLDGVFGSEYTFAAVPITVFADLNLYVEVAQNPLWAAIQGGVGARFNF